VIRLTDGQRRRLRILERDDPQARVVGSLDHCPVVEHHGISSVTGRAARGTDYVRFAKVSRGGRLHGLGPDQITKYQIKRVLK